MSNLHNKLQLVKHTRFTPSTWQINMPIAWNIKRPL